MNGRTNTFFGISWRLLVVLFLSPDAVVRADDRPISRIVFGSCIKQEQPMPILSVMAEHKPDLTLLIGDNIYADTHDMEVMRRKYGQLTANPDFRRLREAAPLLAVWDDHDYGLNDGGADYPERDASQQLFLDFLGLPADSPRRQQPGVYDSRTFGPPGQRLQIILLDARYFRSPLKSGEKRTGGPYWPDDAAEKTMLGEQQWAWLEKVLREPAEIRLIGCGIQMVAEDDGQETWSNLPRERQRLFDLISQTGADGVLLLSGDRHWAELSVERQAGPYPLYDLTSSSLNQPHPRGTPTLNRFRAVPSTYHRENFGLIEIAWKGEQTGISLQIRDAENEIRIRREVPLSDLQTRRSTN